MDAIDILVSNVDHLCRKRGWKRKDLAKKMGVKAESLSRSLNGLPRINTIERIAKALNVPIKCLFEDPNQIDIFASIGGEFHRIHSREEFLRLVRDNRPKMDFTLTSTDDDDGLPF